jgi:small subunit ribosomal protein S4e
MGRRGPKKHLARLAAPSHWMLDKLSGKYAPKPSAGPHKTRECLPLAILLRNRLKYALTLKEVSLIVMQRLIKVDGKVRTDVNYPAGFMDTVSIEKTGEHMRLMYDTKGRFALVRITPEEAKIKLCRVRHQKIGKGGAPYIVTHDGRTIRYADPLIKVNDTVKVDTSEGKVLDFVKFEVGNLAMVTGGYSHGRIGVITMRERHPGGYDIVHLKDANGNVFLTRIGNVFVIGHGPKPIIGLPRGNGIRLTIQEEKEKKLKAQKKSA